jgi:hypothetical protein
VAIWFIMYISYCTVSIVWGIYLIDDVSGIDFTPVFRRLVVILLTVFFLFLLELVATFFYRVRNLSTSRLIR